MIKLNLDPTFDAEVPITVPGQAEPGTIPLTFKYRGRKEYLAWLESNKEEAKTQTEVFLEFVTKWGLSEDFNPANIEIFLDQYPAAYFDIISDYSRLLFESRAKN